MQSLTIIFNVKSWLFTNILRHVVLGFMYCSPCSHVVSATTTVQLFCFYVFYVSIAAIITPAQGLQMKMIYG